MKWKIFVAFAFCVESRKTFAGNNISLEASDLAFVQYLFAVLVSPPNISARVRNTYETFSVECREMFANCVFPGIPFGFLR
jgi:hypothetical protein